MSRRWADDVDLRATRAYVGLLIFQAAAVLQAVQPATADVQVLRWMMEAVVGNNGPHFQLEDVVPASWVAPPHYPLLTRLIEAGVTDPDVLDAATRTCREPANPK